MFNYLMRRLLSLIPTLFIVSVIAFTLIHLTPGDPISLILGPDATISEIERVKQDLGLDRPLYEQYFFWMSDVLRGDLGTSIFVNQPVTSMIATRLETTLVLTTLALVFTVCLGIPAGVISAIKRNTIVDQSSMVIALLGVSMPNFWLGLNLILLFSVYLGWFPTGGYTDLSDSVVGSIKSLILPAIALGFSNAAIVARMTRASMLEVLHQDYVRTARAKGLAAWPVYVRHALRNAFLPIITIVGVVLAGLLGGAVVTETVFTLPGVGRLIVNSVLRRDYPVIQGIILLVAMTYVVLNLLIDVVYVFIDPRVRFQ